MELNLEDVVKSMSGLNILKTDPKPASDEESILAILVRFVKNDSTLGQEQALIFSFLGHSFW